MARERGPSSGQGLPKAQAEGDKVVTSIQVTETRTHQEANEDAGPVLSAASQIEPGNQIGRVDPESGKLKAGGKKARERRPRLTDATGNPILPIKTEGEVRRLIKQEERKAKEEKRLKKEAEKTAEKSRKQSKKTPVEAQAIWKELMHEERLNKRLRIERLKLLSVLSKITEQKKLTDENGRSKVKGVNKMKERVIVIKKQVTEFVKKEKVWIAGSLVGAALLGVGFVGGELIEDNIFKTHEVTPIAGTATPKTSEASGSPTKIPEVVGSWANTAAEAASSFGTDDYSKNPANWEPTAQGQGWHMKEDSGKHNLNLMDFVAEGYWDTIPGSNPQAVVANGGSINVQGATIWDIYGERAAQVLLNQKGEYQWPDGTKHTPQAIGFTPNPSVGVNQ